MTPRKSERRFKIEYAVELIEVAEVPITHSLGILFEKLPADSKPEFRQDIDELTEYATTFRYIKGKAILEESEAEDAIKFASNILDWAKTLIKDKLNLTRL